MKDDLKEMSDNTNEFFVGEAVRFRGNPECVWFVTGVVIRAGRRISYLVSLSGEEVEAEGFELVEDDDEDTLL